MILNHIVDDFTSHRLHGIIIELNFSTLFTDLLVDCFEWRTSIVVVVNDIIQAVNPGDTFGVGKRTDKSKVVARVANAKIGRPIIAFIFEAFRNHDTILQKKHNIEFL